MPVVRDRPIFDRPITPITQRTRDILEREQVPIPRDGGSNPRDGRLSPREYDLFQLYVAENRPFFGIFQTPANNENIRNTDLYKQFVQARPLARLTQRTRDILEREQIPIPPKAVFAPETPSDIVRRTTARREAGGVLGQVGEVGPAGRPFGVGGLQVPPQPTDPPPPGFRWAFDRDLNRWVPQFTGLAPQQQAQQQLEQQRIDIQRQGLQPPPISPFQEQTLDIQRQQLQPQPVTPFQQQQFGLQQREFEAGQEQFQQQFGLQQQQQAQAQAQLQFQQQQAQAATDLQRQQFESQLAANPINWLQYAAFTGQPPVIQPWMVPLGFQNTGQGITPQGGDGQGGAVIPQGLQPGQPLPGFQPTGGTPTTVGAQGTQTFANLPQLTTPSAQLQARWGPTAQAQFLGFERARTGASPAETQFRLGSGRAPGGRSRGFSGFSRI